MAHIGKKTRFSIAATSAFFFAFSNSISAFLRFAFSLSIASSLFLLVSKDRV
jgi:hypothetical protein